jgi:uncharacterized protein YlxP (DUF503 family)
MIVGILIIELMLFESSSLKDKRIVLKSVKDRLKKFNVSIAELDFQDKWQRAELGIALIGNQQGFVEKSLRQIFNQLDHSDAFEIINYSFDYV